MGNLVFAQPRIVNGLLHGHSAPASRIAHEAHGALMHMVFGVKRRATRDLRTKAQLGHFLVLGNSARPVFQALRDRLGIIPDARDNAQSCDNNAAH